METNTEIKTTTQTGARYVIVTDGREGKVLDFITSDMSYSTREGAERNMIGYDESLNPRVVRVCLAATYTEESK